MGIHRANCESEGLGGSTTPIDNAVVAKSPFGMETEMESSKSCTVDGTLNVAGSRAGMRTSSVAVQS